MGSIKVDCPDLIEAFESDSPSLYYFMDRESGEVVKVADDFCADETVLGIDYFTDSRYIKIPRISGDEGLRIRQEYLSHVENENLYDRLEQAIVGRGSLKRFIDALLPYPEDYKAWLRFKNRILLKAILAWKEQLDFEIDLVNTSCINGSEKV